MSWLELMCDFCRQILFLAIFTSAVGISAHCVDCSYEVSLFCAGNESNLNGEVVMITF